MAVAFPVLPGKADEARRFAFADALTDRGQGEAARRERELLKHVHSLGSAYAGDILRRSRRLRGADVKALRP